MSGIVCIGVVKDRMRAETHTRKALVEMILSDFTKLEHQCLIMAPDGEIIATTQPSPNDADQQLTQKLIEFSALTSLIAESPDDILLNFRDRRLYFQKICSNADPYEDLFISVIFPPTLRTYRRTIKQYLRLLRPFLK